jgi:hypothetical protein
LVVAPVQLFVRFCAESKLNVKVFLVEKLLCFFVESRGAIALWMDTIDCDGTKI